MDFTSRPMRSFLPIVITVAVLGILACDGADVAGPTTADAAARDAHLIVSHAGITPRLIEGNISGDGDAVCSNPTVVGDGNVLSGIRVDPPTRGWASYGDFDVRIDAATGMYLRWVNNGTAAVRHVVVKGGPNTTVYDYDGTLTTDGHLASPPTRAGTCPEISNFTICYTE